MPANQSSSCPLMSGPIKLWLDWAGKLLSNKFFVSLLIFGLINGLAMVYHLGQAQPLNFPEKGWTGWAIEDYLKQSKAPDVVFLGSSLVLVPVAGADADYLGRRLDGSQHHRSFYFERSLSDLTGQKVTTFNFALPGQMPSDAYLVVRNFLKDDKLPKVIVYGLGPRDFIDSTLPSPAATDPFRHLSRFADLSSLSCRLMPDLTQRAGFELGKLVYLYGQRIDLQNAMVHLQTGMLNQLLPLPKGATAYSIFARRNLLPDYKACELASQEAFFRPTKASEKTQCFDNLAEYKRRYSTVKWRTFTSQMEFLADLLQLAESRGIHVVVALMPITDLNRSLLKPYAWDAYRNSVAALSNSHHATFFDLAKLGQFELSDFGDTVHLHAGGGQKMLNILARELSTNQAVNLALQPKSDQQDSQPIINLATGSSKGMLSSSSRRQIWH